MCSLRTHKVQTCKTAMLLLPVHRVTVPFFVTAGGYVLQNHRNCLCASGASFGKMAPNKPVFLSLGLEPIE